MEEPKLEIRPKKYKGESTVLSMRIPKEMLQALDDVAQATGRTRNELLVKCIDFALEHMEIQEEY